jgi:hypothetical protein
MTAQKVRKKKNKCFSGLNGFGEQLWQITFWVSKYDDAESLVFALDADNPALFIRDF